MSPPRERDSLQVNFRAESFAQIERWEAAARKDGRSLSDWMRRVLDTAAKAAGDDP